MWTAHIATCEKFLALGIGADFEKNPPRGVVGGDRVLTCVDDNYSGEPSLTGDLTDRRQDEFSIGAGVDERCNFRIGAQRASVQVTASRI